MKPLALRCARYAGWTIASLVAAGFALWCFGALLYDSPVLKWGIAWAFALTLLALVLRLHGPGRKLGAAFALCLIVLGWWFTLRPSNTRAWQPDVAETAWAETDGEQVVLHNVRNCDYRTEVDYTPRWETRTVSLSHLQGADLAIGYWGSPLLAHPIVSFQFDDAAPICFSIETRKETGESYSAVGGIYRQFELIYICADERDVLRLRTNYRTGEDVFLYRTTLSPETARTWFQEYLVAMNGLREHPRWYNAVATNCTTAIRTQHAASRRGPWDWRLLVNGYADEMLYERKALAGDVPFAALKQQAKINDAAAAANEAADFSQRIRAGRIGFNLPARAPALSAAQSR